MNILKHDDILPICFLYLKLSGVWCPRKCSPLLRLFYTIYTAIIIVGYALMLTAEILNIAFARGNRFQTFQENMYLIFSQTNGYVKLLNIVMRREQVILLIDACLTENWNPPRDEKELEILTKHSQIARRITVCFVVPIMICVFGYLLIPLILNVRILPFNAWYPCRMNSSLCYWLSYLHQSIIAIPAVLTLVANDCIIAGFMLQISAQLNLLSHRLKTVPVKLNKISSARTNKVDYLKLENMIINECIESHGSILKFAQLLSETFIETVLFQFCVTLSVICTTIYYLAQLSIFSFQFLAAFMYLACLFIQIFYYCWFGNEIILNNDNVFQSIFITDWTILDKRSNKVLLTMMTVASKPLELFKGVIIQVNLNSFIDIVKISYSAYNVLQNTL